MSDELMAARRELAALLDLLTHGPDDGGAGADMLAIAHRADVLAALVKRLEAAELEESSGDNSVSRRRCRTK